MVAGGPIYALAKLMGRAASWAANQFNSGRLPYTYMIIYIHAAYVHACLHPYIHTYIHPSIHPSIHPYIHTYIHTCCICVCIHTCMHTCMAYIHIHTCIHTYLHSHMHARIHKCCLHVGDREFIGTCRRQTHSSHHNATDDLFSRLATILG